MIKSIGEGALTVRLSPSSSDLPNSDVRCGAGRDFRGAKAESRRTAKGGKGAQQDRQREAKGRQGGPSQSRVLIIALVSHTSAHTLDDTAKWVGGLGGFELPGGTRPDLLLLEGDNTS